MSEVKIIPFPSDRIKGKAKRKGARDRQVKNVNGFKYFNESQIRLLRRMVRNHAELHESKGNITGVREWLCIDILTSSGLRAAECSDLRCGDCLIGHGKSALYVRNGKGSKSRVVQVPQSLKLHLKKYLSWKMERGETTGSDDHLILGQRGPLSPQGISQIVKKWLRICGLYEVGKSAHSLRHSYATELYRRERDLRAVQKQLGHSSIQTTQIYADVTEEDIQDQIKGLWGGPNR